jgi:hypothetical protein
MPTILSTEYFECGVITTPVTRKIKSVYDSTGTGILVWDLDNGDLPDNIAEYFEVYANGKRLDYPAEFTVQEFATATTSTVTILSPIPMTYYTMIKYA